MSFSNYYMPNLGNPILYLTLNTPDNSMKLLKKEWVVEPGWGGKNHGVLKYDKKAGYHTELKCYCHNGKSNCEHDEVSIYTAKPGKKFCTHRQCCLKKGLIEQNKSLNTDIKKVCDMGDSIKNSFSGFGNETKFDVYQGPETAKCRYQFQDSNLSWDNLNYLINYVNSVLSGFVGSIGKSIDKSISKKYAKRLLFYYIPQIWYTSFFLIGRYTDKKDESPLFQTDFINDNFFIENMKKDLIRQVISRVKGFTNDERDKIEKKLLSFLRIPKPKWDGKNEYSIEFSIDYLSYMNNRGKLIEFYNRIFRNIFRDNEAVIRKKGREITTFYNPIFTMKKIEFAGVTVNDTMNRVVKSDITFPESSHVINVVNTVKVENWSPMLIVFFTSQISGITFPDIVCSSISKLGIPIPVSCISSKCFKKDNTCRQAIEANCDFTYEPPRGFSTINIKDYLVVNRTNQCRCYNTSLSPFRFRDSFRNSAICYSVLCDADDRKMFGLTDESCKKNCDKVLSWFSSPNQDMRSENPDQLNSARLNSLCDKKVTPYIPDTFNTNVAIFCLVFTINVLTLLKVYKFNWGYIGASAIIGIFLTVFLSWTLAGRGICDENMVSRCRSKGIFDFNIPQEFCAYSFPCECIFDSDCPTTCNCRNSMCIPKKGVRKTKIVEDVVKDRLFIPAIIVLIIVSILSVTKIQTDKTIFIPLVLSFLLVLKSILYTRRIKKTVFEEDCSSCKGETLLNDKALKDGVCKPCEKGGVMVKIFDDKGVCSYICKSQEQIKHIKNYTGKNEPGTFCTKDDQCVGYSCNNSCDSVEKVGSIDCSAKHILCLDGKYKTEEGIVYTTKQFKEDDKECWLRVYKKGKEDGTIVLNKKDDSAVWRLDITTILKTKLNITRTLEKRQNKLIWKSSYDKDPVIWSF